MAFSSLLLHALALGIVFADAVCTSSAKEPPQSGIDSFETCQQPVPQQSDTGESLEEDETRLVQTRLGPTLDDSLGLLHHSYLDELDENELMEVETDEVDGDVAGGKISMETREGGEKKHN
eukprot:TRINITY_DN58735_c0_g1_i1.p1 TRINITY_DN58735_c0_g1~~TRINITY_DN58735_c0_g1_i1.p1  ORF type:complete len:131 (-),score=22.82 TRINITY_DN58735_c0_g1_i1:45-407(-)